MIGRLTPSTPWLSGSGTPRSLNVAVNRYGSQATAGATDSSETVTCSHRV